MAKEKESKELVKVEPSRAISPFEEMERWFDEANDPNPSKEKRAEFIER